jgi:hypothetical protein
MPSDRARRALLALTGVLLTRSPSLIADDDAGLLVERIVAVVDARPVLLSEARLLEALRGVDRETAVNALVDETLMLREALRLPQSAVTPEDEERAYQSLRARAPARAGREEGELRRMARRQTTILKYIELRFRPQVRIQEEDVRKAFDAESVSAALPPAYESAAPAIRDRLAESQLNERVEAWIKELRSAASIRLNPTTVESP